MSQSGLVKQSGGGVVPGNVPISFVTDAGTAVSIGNVIDVFGGAGISTSGAGQVITITNTSAASITFNADSGSAMPAAGVITLAGSGSITTIAAGSTVTTELTGLTNHNVLVGAGTTTITKVAPSATSGVPLISQGAAADPIFGTVSVAGGGTGAVTLTGILIGNGTSAITGNPVTQFDVLVGGASNGVTSIGPGSTGQVLQSGGAAANPAYSTATYPSVATGAGTILRADGTNWLATTATYPNTTTINQILYSTSNNNIGGLVTANKGVLTTGATGIPGFTTLSLDGQLLIGSTAGVPAAATLTAGSGISITNGSNSITISASGAATDLTVHTDLGDATASANAITIAGSGSITTTGAGSTITVGLTGLTNHNVLIGAGTTTITKVAPSATSGIPLISQGAAADPAFGTAVVAGGGTGTTSFTAYSVITGGTTSTGALQNVSGVGTSGQVLTSNGAGTLPTWQTSNSSFVPNSTINIFDDFIGTQPNLNTSFSSQTVHWKLSGTAGISFNGTISGDLITHPGIIAVAGKASPADIQLSLQQGGLGTFPFKLGGGALTLNWVTNIVTLSTGTNRYTLIVGLTDVTGGVDETNGVYFKYSDNVNSGNWQIITANGGVRTTTNTAVAASTGWHNLQISVNAAASSVTFTIDGVAQTAIVTNIPTAAITPTWSVNVSAGSLATDSLEIDLMYLTYTLTTPR